jgi:hypothetical protein
VRKRTRRRVCGPFSRPVSAAHRECAAVLRQAGFPQLRCRFDFRALLPGPSP